jgi:hypothetical protein
VIAAAAARPVENYATVIKDTTFTSGKSFTSADDDTLYLRCVFNNTVGVAHAAATVVFSGCTKMGLRYCEVDGDAHPGGHGIRLSNANICTNIKIDQCDVHDFDGTGVFPAATGAVPLPWHPGFRLKGSRIYQQRASSDGDHNLYCEANGAEIVGNEIWANGGGNLISMRVDGLIEGNICHINSRLASQPGCGIRFVDSTAHAQSTKPLIIRNNKVDFRTINKDQANTAAIFVQGGGGFTDPSAIQIDNNEILTFPGDAADHIIVDPTVAGITTKTGNFVTQTPGITEVLSVDSAANSGNVTTLTVSPPAGIQDGDLLVLVLVTDGSTHADPITWPTSFVEAAGESPHSAGMTLAVATKVAASESGNYVVSWVDTERCVLVALRCRASSVSWLSGTVDGSALTHTLAARTTLEPGNTLLTMFATDNSDAAITVDKTQRLINKLDGSAGTGGFAAQVEIGLRYLDTKTATIGPWVATLPVSSRCARGSLILRP